MLLDTGVLHCDPHPGNLLRTSDGRLCILDWGMTLEVPSELQYALLEFIAHINTEDYDAIPQDFVNLGFSPEGVSAERVKLEFQERYGSDLTDRELEQAARADMIQQMA